MRLIEKRGAEDLCGEGEGVGGSVEGVGVEEEGEERDEEADSRRAGDPERDAPAKQLEAEDRDGKHGEVGEDVELAWRRC